LGRYWIDKTEVTNEQYYSCVLDGTCDPLQGNDEYTSSSRAQHPAVLVTWFDANRFCRWAGGRLPTEAEWEYAAKGWDALTEPFGGVLPPELANFNDYLGEPVPVGSYPHAPSWVGALDMLGNVWEWVSDWYDSNYYAVSPLQNPSGPESGESRVLRGGSFLQDPYYTNTIVRYPAYPVDKADDFGFRCAGE
jgi:formylglycine-generating enzyme required for sulfatase activity